MSDSVTPWTVARQAPLSMEFSKQEYWSGLPFPLPGDLPDPGIEPMSLLAPALTGSFFITRALVKPQRLVGTVASWIKQAQAPGPPGDDWAGVVSACCHLNSTFT